MLAVPRRPEVLAICVALLAALAPAALAQEPTADFTVNPAAPTEGARVTFRAVLSDHYRKASVWWHFGEGPAGALVRGRQVRHVFATPGDKQVRMSVVQGTKVTAVVTKTVRVQARAPGPNPEPEPTPEPEPAPEPEQPFPLPPDELPPAPPILIESQLPGAFEEASPALMRPFPVVRIAGVLLPWGARIRLLTVRSPRGAIVSVRCRGDGCPLRSLRRRTRARLIHIAGLERRLQAGVRLEILVRKRNLIGKHTRIAIRGGAKPPRRVDRCVAPGDSSPVRCPSA